MSTKRGQAHYISGFHLDALSSSVPLNVDLDTTLTVLAGNLYRLFAQRSRSAGISASRRCLKIY